MPSYTHVFTQKASARYPISKSVPPSSQNHVPRRQVVVISSRVAVSARQSAFSVDHILSPFGSRDTHNCVMIKTFETPNPHKSRARKRFAGGKATSVNCRNSGENNPSRYSFVLIRRLCTQALTFRTPFDASEIWTHPHVHFLCRRIMYDAGEAGLWKSKLDRCDFIFFGCAALIAAKSVPAFLFLAGFAIIRTLLFGADSTCSRSIRTKVRFFGRRGVSEKRDVLFGALRQVSAIPKQSETLWLWEISSRNLFDHISDDSEDVQERQLRWCWPENSKTVVTGPHWKHAGSWSVRVEHFNTEP